MHRIVVVDGHKAFVASTSHIEIFNDWVHAQKVKWILQGEGKKMEILFFHSTHTLGRLRLASINIDGPGVHQYVPLRVSVQDRVHISSIGSVQSFALKREGWCKWKVVEDLQTV